MTGIYESLSVCLYAAGAALLAAAAAVYKRNGLYEYYCLMHGKPVKAKRAGSAAEKSSVRNMDTGTSRAGAVQSQESPGPAQPERHEGGTQVLDGSSDTMLLGKERGTVKTMPPAQGGRTWGRPTGKFRVTKSEVVIHTDRDIRLRVGTKGEKDEG